jgi:hypothetical protein
MLLAGAAVLVVVVAKRAGAQQTAAQLIADAKRDLAPLGKPIVT